MIKKPESLEIVDFKDTPIEMLIIDPTRPNNGENCSATITKVSSTNAGVVADISANNFVEELTDGQKRSGIL